MLAYGANGSPEVLRRKLGEDAELAVVAATLHDFDLVFSSHISAYGAIPSTIHPAPGAAIAAFVLLVDDDQLVRLVETEFNYSVQRLAGARVGEVEGPIAFVSRHGALGVTGAPVRLAEMTQRQAQALVRELRRAGGERGGVHPRQRPRPRARVALHGHAAPPRDRLRGAGRGRPRRVMITPRDGGARGHRTRGGRTGQQAAVPARRLRAAGLQLPLGVAAPTGRRSSARSTRAAGALCNGNPVRLLEEATAEALLRAAADATLIARAEAVERALRADLARPPKDDVVADDRPVAYFSAEFAIHVSLPIYSGGLGALAGDVLKEASDLALPFVGVGLMYRRGYFRQRIDATGWQQEFWVPTDPERTPAVLVTQGEDRTPVRVTVPVGDQDVVAQVWRVDVGRVPLLLLDTELPENDRMGRWITSRLYDGDPETRLAQYTVLGVGGVAALRVLGIEPGIVHMNEGHAALAALEAARAAVEGGTPFDEALATVRERTVFTTHTPVPAGNDTYPAEQVARDAAPPGRAAAASTTTGSSASAARTPTTAASRSA